MTFSESIRASFRKMADDARQDIRHRPIYWSLIYVGIGFAVGVAVQFVPQVAVAEFNTYAAIAAARG